MSKIDLVTDRIYELANDSQKKKIDAWRKHGTARGAAKALGINHSNVIQSISRLLERAAKVHGEHKNFPHMPVFEGNTIGKVTTQVNEQGEIKNVWYRQNEDLEKSINHLKNFAKELPQVEPKAPPKLKKFSKDVIPFINIGDGHIGMMSYEYETNSNFDVDIAKRDLCCAIRTLIDEIMTCERVVIQDMGDMTHYENVAGKTEASGHDLDCDGRFYRMVEVYVEVMRYIIEYALTKFKYVDLIINQGNHSRTNDFWMNIALRHIYEKEKRVTVISNQNVFIPYRMGNTFVMCHHSDKCRPNKLADVMATDYRHDFGEALYKYIDIGHIHHNMVVKEHPSVTIESFNQLATADKYAHDGGWRSRSSINVVYRSKTYGEVGRLKLPLERVRDIIENVPAGTNANKRQEVYTV